MSRYLLQRALCHAALPISKKRSAPTVELSDAQEEFYEHLGEMSATDVIPGINQDEVFDDQFERRAHELQRTPPSTGAMTVIPAKTGPWSGNNNLGVEREFSPDANNRQTVLKLPEWGFPEVWTLCLGMNDYSTADSSVGFSVTAEIEFGCGGVIQTVMIDWLQGMSISLPMNALNLIASYRTGSGEGATTIPPDLRLRASVVHGRSLRAKPTLTVYFEEGEDTIEIPKFAQRMMILPEVSPPGQTPFTFYSSDNYIGLLTTPAGGPGDMHYNVSQLVEYLNVTDTVVGGPRWVPIQPFQRLVRLEDSNAQPDDSIGARCAVFEIAL